VIVRSAASGQPEISVPRLARHLGLIEEAISEEVVYGHE